MRFAVMEALEYNNREELAEKDRFPEGLFQGDVSKGVLLCSAIKEPVMESVVDMCLTMPDKCDVLAVIDTDDYHKINKLQWYKDLMNGAERPLYEYVDDEIEDCFAEYIVPYECFDNILGAFALISIFDKEADTIKLAPPSHSSTFLIESRRLFPLFKEGVLNILPELPEMTDTEDVDIRESTLPEDVINMIQSAVFQSFSLFYFPLIFTGMYNAIIKKNNKIESDDDEYKEGVPYIRYWCGWADYADKYFVEYINLQNKFLEWSLDDASTREDFVALRNRFLDLMSCTVPVLEARLDGLGRNELCPCGSGKKFKKCCGKEYN